MKYIIIFFLFLIQCGLASTSISLKIFLNTDNCFACEGSLRSIQNLNKNIPVEIYTDKNSENIIEDFLGKFELNPSRYKISYVNKIYFNKDNHNSSYFQLCVNNKIISTFYGDELEKHVTGLNAIYVQNVKDLKINLPDTLIFSHALTTYIDSNLVNLNDYKLGKNVVCGIDLNKATCSIVSKTLAKDLQYNSFFQLANMDSSFYHHYKDEALKRGILPSFEQSYLNESFLYLIFSIPYYYFRIPNVLRSDSRLMLMKKNLKNSARSFYYVKDDHMMDNDSTLYFIDTSKGFFTDNDLLTFPLFSTKHFSDACKLYMRTDVDRDTLKFSRFLDITIPKQKAEQFKLDDEIALCNRDLAYYTHHKLIYDYKKNKLISCFINEFKNDILDVKIYGNLIQFLVLKKDKHLLRTYDIRTHKLLFQKKIDFEENINPLSVRIFNNAYIIGLNKKGTHFLLKALNL